jgi:hypothetical protein
MAKVGYVRGKARRGIKLTYRRQTHLWRHAPLLSTAWPSGPSPRDHRMVRPRQRPHDAGAAPFLRTMQFAPVGRDHRLATSDLARYRTLVGAVSMSEKYQQETSVTAYYQFALKPPVTVWAISPPRRSAS